MATCLIELPIEPAVSVNCCLSDRLPERILLELWCGFELELALRWVLEFVRFAASPELVEA